MAILRVKAARELSEEELEKKLKELKLELAKERGKIEVGGVPENPGRVGQIRKTIAMILTIKAENKRKKAEMKKQKE